MNIFNCMNLRVILALFLLVFPYIASAQETFGMEIFMYGFLSIVSIPVIILSFSTAELITGDKMKIGVGMFLCVVVGTLILSSIYDYLDFIFNFELGVYIFFVLIFSFFRSLKSKEK